jgi:hypothetical protein
MLTNINHIQIDRFSVIFGIWIFKKSHENKRGIIWGKEGITERGQGTREDDVGEYDQSTLYPSMKMSQ